MREFRYRPPSQIGIERPLCSACGTRMWLTLIEPADDPSYDARTFECLDCDHSEIVLVEIKSPARTSLPRVAAWPGILGS
jgi:hypothetical protein